MANANKASGGFKMERPVRPCRCPAVEARTRSNNSGVRDTRAGLIDYPAAQFARANPDLRETERVARAMPTRPKLKDRAVLAHYRIVWSRWIGALPPRFPNP